MPVTDLEMFMLRAHIDGQDETAQHAFSQQLSASGEVTGLVALVHSAFVIAVRGQFASRATSADVIRYVAPGDRPAPATCRPRLSLSCRPPLRAAPEYGFLPMWRRVP